MATKKKTTTRKKRQTKKEPETTKVATVFEGSATNRKPYSFNLLDDELDDILDRTRESLTAVMSRRKNHPTGFKSLLEIRRTMIPFRHFAFQYLTGTYGMPEQGLLEIVGDTGLAKSTLAHWIIGGAMEVGVSPFVQESENKPLTKDWAKRALSLDKKIADKMIRRLLFRHTFQLEEMHQNMVDWLDVVRGRKPGNHVVVPLDTPVLMVVDSYSKMMTKDEAAQYHDYGDNLDSKSKAKQIGEGSNQGHAKFSHEWSRKLPAIHYRNNLAIIVVSHQNEGGVMKGGKGGASMSAETSNLYNTTKIGGRALNQNTGMQLVLAYKGLVKDSKNFKIGKTVNIRNSKNSYGAQDRIIEMDIIHSKHDDTEDTYAPNLDFDRWLADWMAENNYLQTKVNKKRYTSPVLGVEGVTSREFSKAFHANQSAMNELGRSLGIYGYEDVVDEIKEEYIEEETTG